MSERLFFIENGGESRRVLFLIQAFGKGDGKSIARDLVVFDAVAVRDDQQIPRLRIAGFGKVLVAAFDQSVDGFAEVPFGWNFVVLEDPLQGVLLGDALMLVVHQQGPQLGGAGLFRQLGEGQNDLRFGAVEVSQLVETLGQNEAVELLQQTLDEEGKADKNLTTIALELQTDALYLGSAAAVF